MTNVVRKEMYCPNCKEKVIVPVVMSTNSLMLKKDTNLRKKYENGTLFKNFCPKCGGELGKPQKKD